MTNDSAPASHSPDALSVLNNISLNLKAVDPVTVVAVVSSAVEIAKNVADIAKTLGLVGRDRSGPQLKEIAEALKTINVRLLGLASGQVAILDAIRELRYEFRDELARSELIQLRNSSLAWISVLDQNILALGLATGPDEPVRILQRIEDQLLGAAGQALMLPTFWGPGAFPSTVICYAAWIQAALITGQRTEVTRAGAAQFRRAFVEALAQAELLSSALQEERAQIQAAVEARMSSPRILVKRTVDRGRQHANWVCRGQNVDYTYLDIEGNLESGYRGKRSHVAGERSLKCRHIPDGPIVTLTGTAEGALSDALATLPFDMQGKSMGFDHQNIVAQLNQNRDRLISIAVELLIHGQMIDQLQALIGSNDLMVGLDAPT